MRSNRIESEKNILSQMVHIYCQGQKHDEPLCARCQELLDYSLQRLEACPFGAEKTFCSKCPVHCYEAEMRERVKEVMRYSGPRMIFHNPLAALRHLLGK